MPNINLEENIRQLFRHGASFNLVSDATLSEEFFSMEFSLKLKTAVNVSKEC